MARKDDLTLDLPGIARRVGRPCTGKAKTGAQRQAAYMARKRAGISVTADENFPPVSSDGASTTVTNSHN
jgi:hypothetical protein